MNILEIDFQQEQLNRIIDVIVSYRINSSRISETERKIWKKIIYYLEEYKINAENRKYFDMAKVVQIINENKDFSEGILYYLIDMDNKMKNVF